MENLKVKIKEWAITVENGLKCFDIIDFGILCTSFMSIGCLFGSAKRKLMRKIAPFVAFLGIISTAYVRLLSFSSKTPFRTRKSGISAMGDFISKYKIDG